MARYEPSHEDLHYLTFCWFFFFFFFFYYYYFRLNPLSASMDMFKFKDGKVQLVDEMLKTGLKKKDIFGLKYGKCDGPNPSLLH